ncbi:MAG: hypothetical protein HRO68_03660 [Nitrosopumilus sp.]|nr:hypothetical protein [Nitrosopumilus sp.]
MGLSNAISGAIILFGITYVMFAFAGFTDTTASITEVSSQKSDLESKLQKTAISLTIPTPPGEVTTFDFDITNTNLEKLWDFDKFDVIITYDSSDTTYTVTQAFDATCPPVDGGWCISAWTGDVFDPEILNHGETITITTEIDNILQSTTDLKVVVSTPNRVVASATITV